MIYEFEKALLPYFKNAIPALALNRMTYAEDADMLTAMAASVVYPSLYFTRENTEMPLVKFLKERTSDTVNSDSTVTVRRIFPFLQVYKSYILVQSQNVALSTASALRFYWADNPYIYIPWPTANDNLKVELRLLYIKVSSERGSMDNKGPKRVVELSWQSQLFMSEDENIPTYQGFEIVVNANNSEQYEIKTL